MSTMMPAKKNTQYIIYVGLVSQADTKLLQVNPTIASGDFKVSTDGAAFANLGTLPVVTPSGGRAVKITLSTSEMNGDNIFVQCVDAAGAEWCDLCFNIQTAARQIDDLSYPATSGRSMVVDASGLVDANAVKLGPSGSGTAQTARDVGASVLLSSGSGTGQLDFTSGVVKANLAQILGTALTETAGLLAGGFKKFFNIATPQATMDHGILVDTVTNLTNNSPGIESGTAQTGGASTITLRSGASAVNSYYLNAIVSITGGTGAGQARVITAYVGSTKVATVDRAWATNPDSSSTYSIIGVAPKLNASGEVVAASVTGTVATVTNGVTVTTNNDKTGYGLSSSERTTLTAAIWAALSAGLTTANSIGKRLVDFITGDSYARLGAPAGASVSADILAVKTDTAAIKTKADNIPGAPAAVSDIPTANQNADALLKRDWTTVTGESARSVLNALRFLRNKWSISGTTLTVTKEDDSTSAWTSEVTPTSGADPITGSDPS